MNIINKNDKRCKINLKPHKYEKTKSRNVDI